MTHLQGFEILEGDDEWAKSVPFPQKSRRMLRERPCAACLLLFAFYCIGQSIFFLLYFEAHEVDYIVTSLSILALGQSIMLMWRNIRDGFERDEAKLRHGLFALQHNLHTMEVGETMRCGAFFITLEQDAFKVKHRGRVLATYPCMDIVRV